MNYPCLMYHEILTPARTGCSVSPANFKKQVGWLVANGYKSIDLRTDFDLTGKDVLITFDDGHKSNLEAARYLKDKGFVGFSRLFVSSEIKKCKHTGNLFKYILNELNINK